MKTQFDQAMAMSVVLHQFPFSHYNEKVRWALAFKNIPHERISYLPGPHMGPIKKLSGQAQTPVLVIDDNVIAGSTEILRKLEQDYPEPALFPADEAQRTEVDKLLEHFDEVVGPASRTLLFSVLIEHGGYLTRMFSTGKPALKRVLYRMSFPLVKGLMAKGNGVNADNLVKSRKIVDDAMNQVVSGTAATGYLVGDHFTAADLCAAALLAPLANPAHPDMSRPQPVPQAFTDYLRNFSGHEAVGWVQRMYQQHRPL